MATVSQDQVLNAAGTHVWMQNPETGGTWECPVDYAETAVDRGWVYTEAYDDSLDGLFDQPGTGPGEELEGGAIQTGFDPSEHTVAEINDHLAQHAESAPGEVERVLELERAGQNRTTVHGIND